MDKRVPVAVSTDGDLRQELAYDNHRSARKYKGEVLRKAISDVAMGRAMAFKAEEAGRMITNLAGEG